MKCVCVCIANCCYCGHFCLFQSPDDDDNNELTMIDQCLCVCVRVCIHRTSSSSKKKESNLLNHHCKRQIDVKKTYGLSKYFISMMITSSNQINLK